MAERNSADLAQSFLLRSEDIGKPQKAAAQDETGYPFRMLKRKLQGGHSHSDSDRPATSTSQSPREVRTSSNPS